jgi:dTDP-4-dehydrorhamnose reductase
VNVLVIGRRGQLATELQRAQWPDGMTVSCLGRDQIDLFGAASCAATIDAADPVLLVNTAAYTAVDRAETDRDGAFALNHLAVKHLATAAQRRRTPLVHISTDYVFDGRSDRPWREEDAVSPLGVYGHSKLAGERVLQDTHADHIILRTSWLFAAHGQNFVRTMLRLAGERERLRIVADQIGCPTPAADLARVVIAVGAALVAGEPATGIYHYAGAGPASWFDFAQTIFDAAGDLVARRPELQRIATAEFGAPALRPAYSVLDCGKIARQFGIRQSAWLSGLQCVVEDLRREREQSTDLHTLGVHGS